jgi:monoamine oxidase
LLIARADAPGSACPRLHFAGEHISLKHSWIEGALDWIEGALESAARVALEVSAR